jgi:hypothetical protein
MSFCKRVAVLKELENGFSIPNKKISSIVRIEQMNGVSELFLSTINLCQISSGAFFLFIIDGIKTIHYFDLALRPYAHGKIFQSTPIVDKGFCAGLCFVKDSLPITIAFGATEDCTMDILDFKRMVADTLYVLKKKEEREKIEKVEKALFIEKTSTENLQEQTAIYNDEAVATENFYALDDQINDKLIKLRGNENARLPNENAMPFECNQKETEKSNTQTYCREDEAYDCNSQKYSVNSPYYLTVKDELNKVFCTFPPEKRLNSLFADSRFAYVTYAGKRHYAVGVVKEQGKEKYICYGVPEKYSPTPPDALKGYATFIPLSIFDLKGDGYWMMFQDAITGDCIKFKHKSK